MKKIISIIAAVSICIMSAVCFTGCKKEFVDTSNAAECGQFDRPDYAKEMEAQNDAGLTHIEIPDSAETVTVDGVEYKPISALGAILGDFSGNYILKNDVEYDYRLYQKGWNNAIVFNGKLHGNNYKVYGQMEDSLFYTIEKAGIYNLIFSSNLELPNNNSAAEIAALAVASYNSEIKFVVNYAGLSSQMGTMISGFHDSVIEECTNYADLYTPCGSIIGSSYGASLIKGCSNYGNLSQKEQFLGVMNSIGGIVGSIVLSPSDDIGKTVIENCNNYGKIIGFTNVGGILGWHDQIYDVDMKYQFFQDNRNRIECYKNSMALIRNCNNYGDIYRYVRADENRVQNRISGFGGITGIGTKIENCKNSGSIYGFETVDPDWQVEYVGGICGAAVSVESCESTGEFNVSSLVKCADSLCGYTIK